MPIQPDNWCHAPPYWWNALKPLARQMRQAPTAAENTLWQRLRNRQVNNLKFRRQYSIERFIVDFCCLELKLIIEVDGSVHDYTQEQDALRQAFLEAQGFTVIRFMNEDVMEEISNVIQRIGEVRAS